MATRQHSNVLFNFYTSKRIFATHRQLLCDLKLRRPITSDIADDVGFPMVYRRI